MLSPAAQSLLKKTSAKLSAFHHQTTSKTGFLLPRRDRTGSGARTGASTASSTVSTASIGGRKVAAVTPSPLLVFGDTTGAAAAAPGATIAANAATTAATQQMMHAAPRRPPPVDPTNTNTATTTQRASLTDDLLNF